MKFAQELKNKNMKWWLGTISFVGLFLFIGIFTYEKTCFILNGVKIKAQIEPIVNTGLVSIKGNAEKAIKITINDREIFVDKKGNFSEVLSPLDGYSIIKIYAKDKFGKEAHKTFNLIKKENQTKVVALLEEK